MEELKCEYCGNIIDLDDTCVHANCSDFYLYMLDKRIDKRKQELCVLILMKLKANLSSI